MSPPRSPRRRSGGGRGSGNRNLIVGVLLGVLGAIVLPGVAAGSVTHVEDTLLAPPPSERVHGDTELFVRVDDAAYMNRVFREANHEVAYCGLLTDDAKPRLEIWLADTVRAGPDFVDFITSNCPSAFREVLLHTHPSGQTQLSATDRQTLARHRAELMCVHAGPLPTEPGQRADAMACYEQLQAAEPGLSLRRVPVETVSPDDILE